MLEIQKGSWFMDFLQGDHRIYGRSYKAANKKIAMSAQKVYAF